VSQKYFPTAVPMEIQFGQHISFRSLRYGGTIKVGPFSVGISLFFLESSLIIEPLIRQHLTTVHTSYGNDHPYTGS
jgi:hypothetical protein